MLDDILEIILDIILDGALGAASSKKVPMPIRIALGGLIGVFFLGIVGLILAVGIRSANYALIVLAALLLCGCVFWVVTKVRQHSA